ncbi:MAG: glycosyltransferase [Limosilactobacillus reuteri]|nr:glycosyltransferase [Limosilactobacillus reuteri]
MKSSTYVFVVLHYKSSKDTINCIKSIEKLNGEYQIVIVDNASNDGSLEKVKDVYSDTKNIIFLKNKENVGFAEGNNVGYRFAKNILKAQFILICNSDLIFDQQDFLTKVKKVYTKYDAYIIGPDIESISTKMHQSPMKTTTTNLFKVNFEILRYRLLLVLSRLYIYDLLKRSTGINKTPQKQYYKNVKKNVVLHGSMLVFTPNFIKREDKAFRTGTFLYLEEDILHTYAISNGYVTIYDPSLHVLHLEDSSTNAIVKNKKEKREFVFRNMIKSLGVYRKYLIFDKDRTKKAKYNRHYT